MTNYSAKHWAIKAEKTLEETKISEQNAKNSEINAKKYADSVNPNKLVVKITYWD